jgi:hypothetical protein
MGFLDSLTGFFTGEGGESRNQQEVVQNVNTDVTGSSNQETQGKQKTTGTQQSTAQTQQQQQTATQLFSPEDMQALQGVLATLVNNFGTNGGTVPKIFTDASAEAVQAGQALNTRAAGAQEQIMQQITPIIAEARRTGEREIGTAQTQLGSVVGSTLDSGVTAATADARAALESQLASLNAQLTIGARETETDERTKALTAILGAAQTGGGLANQSAVSGVGNISEIANILRGAQATQTTTGQTQAQETVTTEQLVEALQNIFNKFGQSTRSVSQSSGTSNTQTEQRGSFLDMLNGIGGLANP